MPAQASTIAGQVDALYFFLVGLTALFGVGISGLVVYFAIRYRRRDPGEVGADIRGAPLLEITWTVIPLGIVLGIFVWSAWLFVTMADPPGDALDTYVVAKQWMWKVQHPGGQREINELHVPVNRNIRLTLTSQDVIHDFFVPAFRVKADVVPGRYTTLWFNATTPGRYPVFCAEYCGTNHSSMRATVVVQPEAEYEAWLARHAGAGTLAATGRTLFHDLACDTCHRADAQGRGPMLTNLIGARMLLQDGREITADRDYVRESILRPQAKIVAGFQAIMPSFQGLVDEDQLLALIEYISIIGTDEAQPPPVPPSTNPDEVPAPPRRPGAAPAPAPGTSAPPQEGAPR
ncbi:MAG: cytochrome c oxidase subunit II [Vicinamibacterales bacterium]